MKIFRSLMLVVALCLLVVFVADAQRISMKIRATDGVGTDSVTIGNDPLSTSGIDSLLPAPLTEYELPPASPTFDVRCFTLDGWDGLEMGTRTNYHQQTRFLQTDMFQLSFQSDEFGDLVTFSWDAGLGSVGGGYWKMYESDGTTLLCDMTEVTSFTYPVFSALPQYVIIKTGDGVGYLTAQADTLANAGDLKGKKGKSEKKKYAASEGEFTFENLSGVEVNDLHVEFSQAVTPIAFSPFTTAASPDGKWKKVDFSGATIPIGGSVTLKMHGNKGKALVASKYWWTVDGVQTPAKVKLGPVNSPANATWLLYPKPNWTNVGEELYNKAGWPAAKTGLTIGLTAQQGTIGGKPVYRYVYHPKYGDVLKSIDKKGVRHTYGAARCLDKDLKGKDILKAYKTLPPDKAVSNELIPALLALQFNVKASDYGFMNTGFGDLYYVDPDTFWNGHTVREIASFGDHYLSCDSGTYMTGSELLRVVKKINSSFAGRFDTSSWSFGQIVVKPIASLADVDFLWRAGATPAPLAGPTGQYNETPLRFSLDQNYPNPFNPTTMISFELPEDAIVTLKIFNVLGQEVATIADRQEFTEGINEVEFDASGFASGVYYYQIVVNDGQFHQVKKMMLLK